MSECSKLTARNSEPTLPWRAGLSHMAQKADEKGIVPPCTLDFSAQRRRVGVGAMDVEGEAPHDRQVLRGVVLPGTVAVLVQDDVENPVQLVLDRPMRALDAQQFPGGNVLREQEVPYGRRLGSGAVHASARGDASHRRDSGEVVFASQAVVADDGGAPLLAPIVRGEFGSFGNAALARAGKAALDGSKQRSLILLERQHVLPAPLEHAEGHRAMAMQRIGGNGA